MSLVSGLQMAAAEGLKEALTGQDKPTENELTADLAAGATIAISSGIVSALKETAEKCAKWLKDDHECQVREEEERERAAANMGLEPEKEPGLADLTEGESRVDKTKRRLRKAGATRIYDNPEAEVSLAAVNKPAEEILADIRENPGKSLEEIKIAKAERSLRMAVVARAGGTPVFPDKEVTDAYGIA